MGKSTTPASGIIRDMDQILKAIRYRNLDEARKILGDVGIGEAEILDDGGMEPAGLLSVVSEDRLGEEEFLRLVGAGVGTLVEVEKISYSGYGPPAEEADYMGFVSEETAYVLAGRRLPVEIENCPAGARDLHHLEAMVLDRLHPLDREALAGQLGLSKAWDFEELFELIASGETTAGEIDRLIHRLDRS